MYKTISAPKHPGPLALTQNTKGKGNKVLIQIHIK